MKVNFDKIVNSFNEGVLNLMINSEFSFNEVQLNIVPDNYKRSYGNSLGVNMSQGDLNCEIEIESLIVQKMHEVSNYFKIGFEQYSFTIESKLLLDSKVIDVSRNRLQIASPWGDVIAFSLHSYERPLQFKHLQVEDFTPNYYINLDANLTLAKDDLVIELCVEDNIKNFEFYILHLCRSANKLNRFTLLN